MEIIQKVGMGNWSFNTGSSVWFHRIITNFIISVRGTLKGLLIDPKPFSLWKKFSIYLENIEMQDLT